MSTVPERGEIDDEYKWDVESIYANDEEWETAYEEARERIGELAEYEGRVTESAETLYELLQLREDVMRLVEQVAAYASLRSSEDTRDQEYQALAGQSQSLQSDAQSAISYLEPELQELSRDELDSFVEDEPALAEYEQFFDDVLRTKDHTRSAEVEELLAELGEVTSGPSEIYSMLSNADMTFPTVEDPDGEAVEISQGNFTKLQKHEDRAFRQEVYEAYFDEWEDVRNTVGTALKTQVKKDVTIARARNYDTAREAALDGPNVPVEVYDTLVETVEDTLDPLHRHAELKREALELDELRMWDLYMSLSGDEGPEISYELSKQWVIEAVEPLGTAYRDRMAEGLENRWVDVYENRGKRSGAFSSGTYDTQPFILMNYQDDAASLYTLAHELGHSMHSELANDAQPWHDAGYEIFVAEVASTVNETLLTHHLLELDDDELVASFETANGSTGASGSTGANGSAGANGDNGGASSIDPDDIRLHVLDQYLERFRSTLYRQTMFADFEHRIHRRAENDEPLTPDVFDEIYGELKETFYEPAEVDDRIVREWERIPHFYYNFYVYQYATGLSAAVAIVERILEEGEPAAADYREMLRAGGSVYPVEALDIAGIDVTSPEPIESALQVYDEYLDRAEALL